MTDNATERRLRNELKDLKKNKLDYAQAIQDENDKFIFYFLIIGDKEDPKNKLSTGHYEGGYYIGKILLPKEYPLKPGDFMMLTPNGRFEINKKICLTNSGYHSESWSPIWSIRNIMIGFISIFYVDLDSGISHIKMSKEKRQTMAIDSVNYNITHYPEIWKRFDQFIDEYGNIKPQQILNPVNPKKIEIPIIEQPIMEHPKLELPQINNNLNNNEFEYDELDQILADVINKSKLEEENRQNNIKQQQENEEFLMNNVIEESLKSLIEEQKKIENINTNNIKQCNSFDESIIEPIKKVKINNKKEINKINKYNKKNNFIENKCDNPNARNKSRNVLVNENLETIKKMTLNTFDITNFYNVHKLIWLHLSELD